MNTTVATALSQPEMVKMYVQAEKTLMGVAARNLIQSALFKVRMNLMVLGVLPRH